MEKMDLYNLQVENLSLQKRLLETQHLVVQAELKLWEYYYKELLANKPMDEDIVIPPVDHD